ncbi:MAG: ABC transporter permease [Phycisphaerales bacterium]|nr:ABC transporter permease [Planctomycetota bacterium]MCH8508817.1 ABC transporter permease [Phycisphaerales bacterium]
MQRESKDRPADERPGRFVESLLYPVAIVGRRTIGILDHTGSVFYLLLDAMRWVWRGLTQKRYRLGKSAIVSQIIRVGVQSVFIVSIVSGAVGLILALQLAPPLDEFGQRDKIANIIAVAVLRELGPLIGAIVLTGFAGASIAAEIGTMVVSEEIEALEAHALNPVRFLVVPRVLASLISMTCLGVISSFVAIVAALAASVIVLGVPYETYMTNMLQQAKQVDFWTGVFKGGVFGTLIGIIACANGLKVTGGAAGVGRATTYTVVECVVAIVIADLVFTAIFFALELF